MLQILLEVISSLLGEHMLVYDNESFYHEMSLNHDIVFLVPFECLISAHFAYNVKIPDLLY